MDILICIAVLGLVNINWKFETTLPFVIAILNSPISSSRLFLNWFFPSLKFIRLKQVETRPGVNKVKPKVWFKYSLLAHRCDLDHS